MSLHAVLAPSPVTGVRASWRRISPVPCALADVPPLRYRLPAEIITSAESERIHGSHRQAGPPAPRVHIGKADVTDAIAKQAEEALDAHELIKCSVQDGSLLSCREAADQLAELVGAEVVQVIGHRFSLYRASSRKDIEHIKLG